MSSDHMVPIVGMTSLWKIALADAEQVHYIYRAR
jgi:hypothetical protein